MARTRDPEELRRRRDQIREQLAALVDGPESVHRVE